MTILCFTGNKNTPNKYDYTGAFDPECKAFMKLYGLPAASRLKVDLALTKANRAKSVLDFIRVKCMSSTHESAVSTYSHSPTSVGATPPPPLPPPPVIVTAPLTLVFFCHGLSTEIQLGFNRQRVSVDSLSKTLRDVFPLSSSHFPVDTVNVVLYACSTGASPTTTSAPPPPPPPGGDDGFADRLRDSLCRHGFTNSRVVAHTTAGHTTKNPFVRFFDGLGSPVGSTGGQHPVVPFSKPLWGKWVSALKQTDYRFVFPFKSISEIHNYLLLNTATVVQ